MTARKNPGFKDLSYVQKAILDIAHLEGRVLIAGTGMAHYITGAQSLCKKGLMEREEGTNWYRITNEGTKLISAGMVDELRS